MDLANLAVAALVFGQFLGTAVRWEIVVFGVAFFSVCVMLSLLLRRKEEKNNGDK